MRTVESQKLAQIESRPAAALFSSIIVVVEWWREIRIPINQMNCNYKLEHDSVPLSLSFHTTSQLRSKGEKRFLLLYTIDLFIAYLGFLLCLLLLPSLAASFFSLSPTLPTSKHVWTRKRSVMGVST
jgi:hypothetical protein